MRSITRYMIQEILVLFPVAVAIFSSVCDLWLFLCNKHNATQLCWQDADLYARMRTTSITMLMSGNNVNPFFAPSEVSDWAFAVPNCVYCAPTLMTQCHNANCCHECHGTILQSTWVHSVTKVNTFRPLFIDLCNFLDKHKCRDHVADMGNIVGQVLSEWHTDNWRNVKHSEVRDEVNFPVVSVTGQNFFSARPIDTTF